MNPDDNMDRFVKSTRRKARNIKTQPVRFTVQWDQILELMPKGFQSQDDIPLLCRGWKKFGPDEVAGMKDRIGLISVFVNFDTGCAIFVYEG